MLDLLKYANARLGEASSFGGISILLALLHVNASPGAVHTLSLWLAVVSAVLAVVLADVGKKPAVQIAGDALAALVAAIKAMPDGVKTTAQMLMAAAVCGLMLTACGSQTPAQTQANVSAAITIAADALPCYDAVKAATATNNSAANVLSGAQVVTMNSACAALDSATAGLIASAVNTGAPVQTSAN